MITADFNLSLGMVNNLFLNGARLDFANINMVVKLSLMTTD